MAQLGSVLEWGSRGRRFKSSYPDHEKRRCESSSAFFLLPNGERFVFAALDSERFSLNAKNKCILRKSGLTIYIYILACRNFEKEISRCCYAPYVELDAAEYKTQEKVKSLQKSDKELEFYKRANRHQRHAEEITGPTGDAAWYKYQKLASDFIKKDIDGIKVEGFVSKEGTLFKYEKGTNTFGMLSNKGTISTMFNPIEKIDYWKTQISKYKGV